MLRDSLMASTRAQIFYTGKKFPIGKNAPYEIRSQFILHHEFKWTGSDVDFVVPLVEITKELFPDFCSVSFDRGFHSPANRTRLDEVLVDNVLPKKGRLSKADREREQGETFAAMRRQHPGCSHAKRHFPIVTPSQKI